MTREHIEFDLAGLHQPLGIAGSDFLSRASWPVALFPYIEQNQLFEQFNNGLQNPGFCFRHCRRSRSWFAPVIRLR